MLSDLASCVDGSSPSLLTSCLRLQNSLAEGQQPRARTSAHQELDGLLLKDSSGGSRNSSSCDFEDFVMVPAHLPSKDPESDLLSAPQRSSLQLNGSCVAAADLTAEGQAEGQAEGVDSLLSSR